jgi:hypothetical protein
MFIDIGAYGKQNDGCTSSTSTLYHSLEDSESTLLKPASFEESGTEMPFVVLGDEAYPLKTNLMRSFVRKKFSCEQRIFNYRLSRARRCVECAFGILTEKWRSLNKATEMNVNTAERIVRCICLLHNIIMDLEGTTHHSDLQQTSQIRESHKAKANVSGRSNSRSSKGATDVTNVFKAYFNGPTAAIILSQNH